METPDLLMLEREYRAGGITLLCGVDEAGRGPLAGPVYAAAVILPAEFDLPGLNDSKKLSPKKRERLYDLIKDQAVSYCIASASEREIDEVNILQATFLAMNRAVLGLSVRPQFALVDGNRDPGLDVPTRCVVGGDAKSASIAAASILAKVERDRVMEQLHEQYPQYAFDKHKGYPTKLHYEKIAAFGPSPVHRQSFLKKFYAGHSR
ncbi:ribonuclease HII [Zongyangia hominis]|nr:ribonuclease HII [Zongyangia hominis]